MRVVILTSSFRGLASLCLDRLAKRKDVNVALVIYSEGRAAHTWRTRRRQAKKILKVGIWGVLNEARISPWFRIEPFRFLSTERLDDVARRHAIRLEKTATTNSQRTIELLNDAQADLGITIGSGYVASSVFSVPREGFINIHHELLPQVRGAYSIIWQLYHGSLVTGYTIHRLDRSIDTGPILFQEKIPIELKPTLRETVSYNNARLFKASIDGLERVLEDYISLAAEATPQEKGRLYMTPSLWQYLRILRQHRTIFHRLQQSGKVR